MTRPLSLERALAVAGATTILFQVGLHLFFDLNIGVARFLRDMYLGLENSHGKGPSVLCDVFLPAAIAGVVFGRISTLLSQKQAWLASGALGFIIAALMTIYPKIVSYDLWWLPHDSWRLARDVLLTGLLTSLGCRLAVEAGQRAGQVRGKGAPG